MPRVRFIQDFDFQHAPRVLTAYKAGTVVLVSQAAADAAIKAGKAEPIEPTRGSAEPLKPRG